MKKILTLLIIAIIVAFTSCGGGSSEEAKELLSQMLTVVGIPQDIIVNICQDENDDGICSELELDSVSFIKKIFRKILK